MSETQKVLRGFYEHLVVRGGGYIDVSTTGGGDEALFIEWVREKLRELFEPNGGNMSQLELRVKEMWPGRWVYWVGLSGEKHTPGYWTDGGPYGNAYRSRRRAVRAGRKELNQRLKRESHESEWEVVE